MDKVCMSTLSYLTNQRTFNKSQFSLKKTPFCFTKGITLVNLESMAWLHASKCFIDNVVRFDKEKMHIIS